jgi:7-cyano-7-deazaguanine synthase
VEDAVSVLLLSGGLDSLVLLARECAAGRPPLCVSFDYGQRHRRELDAAARIAERYEVGHVVLTLPPLAGSALTGGGTVPKGLHFADAGQGVTVVPNRNAVMIAHAASLAVQHGRRRVLFAAHAGDRDVYPDCREGFVRAMSEAMILACGVSVEAPFVTRDKRGIVALGKELRVPFDWAWSCYEGGETPCGECGACRERRESGA